MLYLQYLRFLVLFNGVSNLKNNIINYLKRIENRKLKITHLDDHKILCQPSFYAAKPHNYVLDTHWLCKCSYWIIIIITIGEW